MIFCNTEHSAIALCSTRWSIEMAKWLKVCVCVGTVYTQKKTTFGLVIVDQPIIAGFKVVPDHLVFHFLGSNNNPIRLSTDIGLSILGQQCSAINQLWIYRDLAQSKRDKLQSMPEFFSVCFSSQRSSTEF